MLTQTVSRLLVVIVIITLEVAGAHAATKVVSKWGTDTPTCGAGSSPCETIGYALSIAVTNDRVLVHPGIYFENLTISTDGLELTSLSGRSATAIIAADTSSRVITIAANNVRIGEKANGFSIENGSDGIYVVGINSKIEGNRIEGNTNDGILIYGPDSQVRFNEIKNNGWAIFCDCTSALIQKNTADSNTEHGFVLDPYFNGTSVNQNIIVNNGGDGLVFSGSEGGIINSNVMENNGVENVGAGLRVFAFDQMSIRGNIASRNNSTGMNLTLSGDSSSAVKHNMAVSNSGLGILTQGTDLIDFENNASIGGHLDHMVVSSQFSSFTDNTTYGPSLTSDGIDNDSGVNLTVQNHFLVGEMEGPVSGTFATKPNLTKVGIAKGLGF